VARNPVSLAQELLAFVRENKKWWLLPILLLFLLLGGLVCVSSTAVCPIMYMLF
jgi:hypothetical protein